MMKHIVSMGIHFLMSKVSILQTSYERQNYAFPMFHEIACVAADKGYYWS